MKFKQINWVLIIGMLLSVAFWVIVFSGCMRTDNHRETYYPTGELKSYHSTSNTSWCVDSNFKEATIDPDGTITVKNYDKKADSLDVEIDPLKKKGKLSTSPKGD